MFWFKVLLGLALALCALGSAVAAERELHVVAVRYGWVEAGDFRREPQAHVLVDRPGVDVVLVLLDPGSVEWFVDFTEGSSVENILLGGNGTSTSDVYLKEIPFISQSDSRLPYIGTPAGKRFRTLLTELSEATGIERISSFQSAYRAREEAYRVREAVAADPHFAIRYLEEEVADLNTFPAAFQTWVKERPERPFAAEFIEDGIEISHNGERRFFPVTPGIQRPFLPSGVFFDAETQAIYALAYGGEGVVYRVDSGSGEWEVFASLRGYDAAEILWDRSSGKLILTGAFNRPGEIAVLGPNGTFEMVNIGIRRFPGLMDLFDFPNETAPTLTPRALEGDWLLADVVASDVGPLNEQKLYRVYAINLRTQAVRLLDYRNE